jgi:hypothetical protein
LSNLAKRTGKVKKECFYLELLSEQTLKLLLKREGEGKPTHVGAVPTLPEVHHTLEVILSLIKRA